MAGRSAGRSAWREEDSVVLVVLGRENWGGLVWCEVGGDGGVGDVGGAVLE